MALIGFVPFVSSWFSTWMPGTRPGTRFLQERWPLFRDLDFFEICSTY
jgi:hypothetical protein